MIRKLIELAQKKYEFHLQEGSDWAGYHHYFEAMKDEILEIEDEIRENNQVYLEDELGDLLRDYLNVLYTMKEKGYISSIENVIKRAEQKYEERLSDKIGKISRDETKRKQKDRRKKEHQAYKDSLSSS